MLDVVATVANVAVRFSIIRGSPISMHYSRTCQIFGLENHADLSDDLIIIVVVGCHGIEHCVDRCRFVWDNATLRKNHYFTLGVSFVEFSKVFNIPDGSKGI